uniref:Uncharacterized protein n=1 Tax=Hyaloperonospora arabidopsidis (strain Emoy2) TaxID=559515 RepID=M4BCS2_HYAAE
MQLRALVQEFDDCASPRSRVLSALATVLIRAHVNDAGKLILSMEIDRDRNGS